MKIVSAALVAAAAQAEASRRGSTVVIAVVDDGGHLIVLHRLDDTQVASVEVGIGKARTAAIFRRPSKDGDTVFVPNSELVSREVLTFGRPAGTHRCPPAAAPASP